MEWKFRETAHHSVTQYRTSGSDPDTDAAGRRLERLNILNAEIESRLAEMDSPRKRPAAKGVGFEHAYSLLGASLGTIPPGAFFLRIILDKSSSDLSALSLLGVLVVFTASLTGFFSGRIVGRIVRELHAYRWPLMLAALPFVGITWGLIAGGAGGAIIFLIGAIPGAVMGAAVGSVALTIFAAIHRILKRGDEIERGLFVPAAIGISAVIAAAFLGATA